LICLTRIVATTFPLPGPNSHITHVQSNGSSSMALKDLIHTNHGPLVETSLLTAVTLHRATKRAE
jgi:uncharacterized membrane protein